jgi:glycosyltransferase involved in cell wall biosynthesis
MKPAILLVSYFYPPDVQSGAARPHRLAKYLERLGHPVEVVAAGHRLLKPVVEGNVHRLRGGAIRGMPRDFATLLERASRQTLFVHDPGGTWAPRVVSYARRWMQGPVKPVVLSSAPPMTTHAAAWWMKRRYGTCWIADFRDPLAGNPFRPGWRAACFDRWLERVFLGGADVIIANTDTVAERWQRRYPRWAAKIHVLWNGFDPEERLAPRPLPPRDHKVLAHVGGIYGERSPELLLASVRRLLERAELAPGGMRVRFVGAIEEGFLRQPLWRELAARGVLEVGAPVPREQAQRIMAESDYLLLLDVTRGQAGLQVPAKLFEYVQIGRPVVACTTRGSPVDRILERSGVAYTGLYPDAPAEETDQRLLACLRAPGAARAPSEWFEASFDARRQAECLSALAERLTASAG